MSEWTPCLPPPLMRRRSFNSSKWSSPSVSRACWKLNGEHARREPLGVGHVGDVDGGHAVDEMLQVVPAGDDDVVVPIVGLESGFDFFEVADMSGDFFLPVGGPDNLLAGHRHD